MRTEGPSLLRSADQQRKFEGGSRTSVGRSNPYDSLRIHPSAVPSVIGSLWSVDGRSVRAIFLHRAYGGRNFKDFEEVQETYRLMLFADA